MVSTTILPASKTATLSYAERAKKAQNIKSSISAPPPPRIANQSAGAASNTSPTSTISNSSTAPSSVLRSVSSTSAEGMPNSSVILGAQSSPPIGSPTATSDGVMNFTNDEPRSSTELAVKALSIVAAHTSPQKAPVLNFWNLRKEQMAASRSPLLPSAPSNNTPNTKQSTSRSTSSQDLPKKGSTASSGTEGRKVVVPESSYLLPGSSPAVDPFVVRPLLSAIGTKGVPLVPSLVDIESWPEVGKAVLLTSGDHSSPVPNQAGSKTSKDCDPTSDGLQPSTGGLKKGEKTKWVPIPPEELQAAADAQKSSRSHSRKTSRVTQRSSNGQGRGSPSTSDQPHKRTNSGKNSASQSASHSRVQSRSESLQSSPRFPRGRRLPGDEKQSLKPNGIHGANGNGLPSRSSGTNSPHQIQLPLSSQLIPTSLDTAGNRGIPAPLTYPSLVHGPNISLPPQVYGFHPAQHLPSIPPSNYPHLSYSPINISRNGSPSLQTLPMPPTPYPATVSNYPIYPVYGAFDYGASTSTTPPLYWNGHMQPRSGQHSPVYPPVTQRPVALTTNVAFFYPDSQANRVNGAAKSEDQMPEESEGENGLITSDKPEKRNLHNEKPVVFGTIDLRTSSPSPEPVIPANQLNEGGQEPIDVSFATFSIGISPDEQRPRRLRSHTGSTKNWSRTGTVTDVTASIQGEASQETVDTPNHNETKVDSKEMESIKWEFGTTSFLAPTPSTQEASSTNGAQLSPMSGSVSPAQLPMDPKVSSTLPSPAAEGQELGDGSEFEVKDYGFGFGTASGSGNAVEQVREGILAREREFEENKMEKQQQQRLRQQELVPIPVVEVIIPEEMTPVHNVAGRPRRSFNGNFVHERNAYNGKRGRNYVSNGFSRGLGTRPQHIRGGFHPSGPYAPRSQHPPITIPTSLPYPPIIHLNESPTNYFPPPRQQPATYIPTPFEPYPLAPVLPSLPPQQTAPFPLPLTTISFPLDPIRYHLLGQLEYYLSPQNIVTDFFLRQRMDSQGWIPIPLIASFNRVKQMTLDINLVRDTLLLSSMVQVKDNWVRMGDWERFVLPDATPSIVEGEDRNFSDHSAPRDARTDESNYYQHEASFYRDARGSFDIHDARVTVALDNDKVSRRGSEEWEGIEDDAEDEEDDVVFVLENEAGV